MSTNANRIEREIVVQAPRARVWRALSNAEEFGDWFGAALKEKKFVAGERVQGQITYPGYEHLIFDVLIERMKPEQLLTMRWHPGAIDPAIDHLHEPTTLVEFTLEDVEGGTRVRVVESGFEGLPPFRRLDAFRANSAGWDEQMKNIQRYVAATF